VLEVIEGHALVARRSGDLSAEEPSVSAGRVSPAVASRGSVVH